MNTKEEIKSAIESISGKSKITVLTGAGISAESGIPTFRGSEGLWKNYRATELATPEAFSRDPETVWEFYNWRRSVIGAVDFNAAHRALVDLEKITEHFTLITQNIDGLHLRAGSKNILEIHGNIWKLRCTKCGAVTLDYTDDLGTSPLCTGCGGLLRPNVIWFGESLDNTILYNSIKASRDCEVMLVIGTSAVVQPAASFPVDAIRYGAVVIEINIESTPLSPHCHISILGKATEILPEIVSHMSL